MWIEHTLLAIVGNIACGDDDDGDDVNDDNNDRDVLGAAVGFSEFLKCSLICCNFHFWNKVRKEYELCL
jgi:hypothetical protein